LGGGFEQVTDLTGRRLGAYHLQALLGAGGMGEVYRAHDTRLGREVAIKILPQAFIADPDRLARFEREARVLASLNHPNIGAIYGLEEAAGVRGLVLELVEGETLAERIRRPVPIAEALGVATQIADALDAAHERGIVHRDLKPANIKVTPDGIVKVLDFGLAKAATSDGDGFSPDLTHSPTVTAAGTREGVLLGTVAYMSPEQARGQTVDKRADIWAFGCVLYEMLTGRSAFGRATTTDTLAALVERDPEWSALPAGLSTNIRRLLQRCLEKDPKRRLRDIGDAKLEIEAAVDGDVTASVVAREPAHARPWRVVTAAAVLGAAVVGAFLWRDGAAGQPAGPSIGPLLRMTSDSGFTTEPSISADGRLIAYATDRSGDRNLDIWVQQATGGPAIRLTSDPADDRAPDVSPDGSLIAFRSERTPRGIYVAPSLGGDARLIAPDGMAPRFSPDGRSIAFWTGRWLAPRTIGQERHTFVVPTSGGETTRVAVTLPTAGDPVWSPDGKALIVFGRQAISGEGTDPDWWWVPMDGGPAVQSGVYERLRGQGLELGDPNTQPYPVAWTSEGLLFSGVSGSLDGTGNADSQSIWTIAVDPRTGRVAGDAIRLTHGITIDTAPAMSRDGRLVFAATSATPLLFALPLDANAGRPTGPLRRIRDDSATTGRAGASEDGQLVVFPRYEFGAGGVWIRDLRTGRERQLAATPRTPLNPVISVDGRWVAYTVTTVDVGGNSGAGAGYVVDLAGGAPRKVCDGCQIYQWTRDNRHVVITEQDDRVMSRVDLATGVRVPIIQASSYIDRPLLSPNQRWLIFNTDFNQDRRVFVARLYDDRATPENEWMSIHQSVGAERSAGLSPDGQLLYLLLERDGFRCLYALRLDPETGRRTGEPFLVHHVHEASRQWGSTGFGSATVTGMFLASLYETTGNIWMTTVTR
jgi:Tol biopolymer transport system component